MVESSSSGGEKRKPRVSRQVARRLAFKLALADINQRDLRPSRKNPECTMGVPRKDRRNEARAATAGWWKTYPERVNAQG